VCGPPYNQFSNNWVNDGEPAGYYKDELGLVHLKGHVKAQVDPTGPCDIPEIFTLPTADRPGLSQMFTAWSGTPGPARIDVQSDGKVTVQNPAVADQFRVSLDGIVLRAGS